MNITKSPDIDGRKRLFWSDDMENYNTMKWTGIGGTALSYINTSEAYEGNYCLRAANATDAHLAFEKLLPAFPLGRVSTEIYWKYLSAFTRMELWIDYFSGAERYTGEVVYNNYYSQGNGYYYYNYRGQTLPTIIPELNIGTLVIESKVWNFLRLTVDFSTKKYVSVSSNETDANGIPISAPLVLYTPDDTGRCGNIRIGVDMDNIGDAMHFDAAKVYVYQ